MEDNLSILLFVLVVWLILYLLLEFNIINNKRKEVKKVFLDMDNYFIKRLNILSKMIDIIKAYDKNQFDDFGSDLYDYVKNYKEFEFNKKLEINENINKEMKKFLLVRQVYPELDDNVKYVKMEKQLIRINKVISKLQVKYNRNLRDYLARREVFPSGIICIICRFYSYNYFNLKE